MPARELNLTWANMKPSLECLSKKRKNRSYENYFFKEAGQAA